MELMMCVGAFCSFMVEQKILYINVVTVGDKINVIKLDKSN